MDLNDSMELDDDDWYAESFTRYNELVMLEMEWTVQRLCLTDRTTVTTLAERAKESPRRQFLVQYSLPTKIIRTDQVVKKGDMTIVSVLPVVDESLVDIECVPNDNSTVASIRGQIGLKYFCQDLDDSGKFTSQPRRLEVPLLEPAFCLVDAHSFLTARQTTEPCFIANFETDSYETLNLGDWNNSRPESSLVPEVISSNSVAVCRQSDGRVVCFDLRSRKPTHEISARDSPNSTWTFASSYRGNRNSSSQLICFKSSGGDYELYDLRAPSLAQLRSRHASPAGDDLTLKFSPDSRSVSTTTSSGLVLVHRLGQTSFEPVFTHEGHLRMEGCSRVTRITDHSWYDSSCVISSADNDSFNIWQFNA